jgi:hypothetical protein
MQMSCRAAWYIPGPQSTATPSGGAALSRQDATTAMIIAIAESKLNMYRVVVGMQQIPWWKGLR